MDKQEKQKTEEQESKVQGTKVRMDAGKAQKKNKGSEAKSTKETTGNEPQIQVCRVMKRQGENGTNRT